MNLERVMKNERMMKVSTGMSKRGFEDLLETFVEVLKQEQMSQERRKRKIGGGRNGKIEDPRQKLFFILLYVKTYPTFDLAAIIFDSSKSRTNEWFLQILPILEKTLGRKCVLPKRKISSREEFLQSFPELKDIFIDVTERLIQRPQSPKNQKKNYSGKKKKHTRKNTIACDK